MRIAAFATGVLLGPCRGADSADFTISLKAQAGGREQAIVSGQSAAAHILTVKVKEVLSVQWSAINGGSAPPLSDVTLHVFLDRGDARAEAPKPGPRALYESALILDFEPGGKSTGEFRIPVLEPGNYLMKAETIGAAKKLGKEAAAALQVLVR